MNVEMSYLLGMICGNGEIKRSPTQTIISIDIPHKKLETEFNQDVKLYVKASIADIRAVVEPLISTGIQFIQNKSSTTLSFFKPNDEYLMREILRYTGSATSHENIRISNDMFDFSKDEKIFFLRGFADVTGYIRRSNYFFKKYMHRVYLEIPKNWGLVADVCNLLKSINIPVQTIDWAHPNIRDGKLTKYKQGNINFWKKEHQVKIWANEFEPIGFGVIHKTDALMTFAKELVGNLTKKEQAVSKVTHRFYWDTKEITKQKPIHPCENDIFIPIQIRGQHFNSWKDIAKGLGYVK